MSIIREEVAHALRLAADKIERGNPTRSHRMEFAVSNGSDFEVLAIELPKSVIIESVMGRGRPS